MINRFCSSIRLVFCLLIILTGACTSQIDSNIRKEIPSSSIDKTETANIEITQKHATNEMSESSMPKITLNYFCKECDAIRKTNRCNPYGRNHKHATAKLHYNLPAVWVCKMLVLVCSNNECHDYLIMKPFVKNKNGSLCYTCNRKIIAVEVMSMVRFKCDVCSKASDIPGIGFEVERTSENVSYLKKTGICPECKRQLTAIFSESRNYPQINK